VAGVAAQLLHARRGAWGFAKERTLRLLPVLVFGMLVVVPPQSYFELLTQAPQLLPGDGAYLDFWAAYVQGGSYCQGRDCLSVPTWNHLWFIAYLWPYALLLPPLLCRLPQRALQLPDWAWLLLPALPLIAYRLLLFPRFPSTHDFVHDAYNHAVYASLFALGWASRTPLTAGLWAAAQRQRWLLLGLALAAWGGTVFYFSSYPTGEPPEALRQAMRAVWALLSWWGIAAACGWALQLGRDTRLLRWLSGAVFCLYVLHQTVIVLLTRLLLPLHLPWGLEALLLIGLTAGTCLGAYALLRRVPGLRALVGVHEKKTPRAQASKPCRNQALPAG
jgi:peptidoglycan/LPS O-acetylase OafA/YrhL